jgi:hypothetical protein
MQPPRIHPAVIFWFLAAVVIGSIAIAWVTG